MHVQVVSTMRFIWALRQSTQTAIQHASVTKQSTFRLASAPLPVLGCNQQTIALSKVHNVNNTFILRQSIIRLPLVATAHPQPQGLLSLSQIKWRLNPLSSINTPSWSHKHSLGQSFNKQRRACKIIKDIDIIFIIQLDIVSIFIGSQQTQHVALQ